MQLSNQETYSFDDVLIVPKKSDVFSRTTGCHVSTTLGDLVLPYPILAANMDTISGEEMVSGMNRIGGGAVLHRNMTAEEALKIANNIPYLDNLIVATGIWHNDSERIQGLLDLAKRRNLTICVDVAHGHSVAMETTLKTIRDKGYEGDIIAGNVATYNAKKDLVEWGANIIKTGIGPGSVCTTRIKTGCGLPQLTAIVETCWDKEDDVFVIADGGIRSPGDAAKALAAGADAVMMGGVFSGSDLTPGWHPNKQYCEFRGMASLQAKKVLNQKGVNAEGISKVVRCLPEGSTKAITEYFVEGIKSAMSYVGATNLEELRERALFVKVSPQTLSENHPHQASVAEQVYGYSQDPA